ncbi:hypothetical protein ND2E_2842 [Colwellia psychrerythraea]|uniref:Uncharacterized protein n=1 Tax=Colwellia psychrerythraea TaxID=28229 RepID=A0A099KPC7_COLPS|nr:hypothetical protein ND2E_2842 [Colwellia psychrerythraea]
MSIMITQFKDTFSLVAIKTLLQASMNTINYYASIDQ